MNFLEALKSGKRFRPKGRTGWWCPDVVEKGMDLDGTMPFSFQEILGEWEVEETPCEHEPAADRIKIIPRLDGDDKPFEEFIPVFDGEFHCKHCGEEIEPTGWRLVK